MNKFKTIILLIFIILLTFGNGLNNELIGDAKSFLGGKSFYKDPENFSRLFDQSFIMNPAGTDFAALTEEPVSGCISYRPVTALTFFADALFWKERAFGYHLTNVILHALVAALLFLLVSRMAQNQGVALLAALLFAVHPVQLEVVNYIGYRSDLLMALFFILAVLFYDARVRTGRGKYFVAMCLAALAALFAKETALTLPVVLMFYHHFFLPHQGIKSLLNKQKAVYLTLAGICAFHLFIYFFVFPSGFYPKFLNYGLGWWQHAVLSLRIFYEYLLVLLLPFNVTLLPPLYAPAISPLPIFKIIAAAAFLLLSAVYFLSRARKKNPVMAFGAAWFFITFLPGSNILPLPNPFAFRFLYLPSAGFMMAAAFLLHQAALYLKDKFAGKKWHVILPAGVIALCALTTLSYNEFLKNNITACREMIRRYPDSIRPYWVLGLSYLDRGEKEQAAEYFLQCLKRDVNNPFLEQSKDDFLFYYFLSRCYPDGSPETVAHLKKSVTLRPDYLAGHLDLARACILRKDFQPALETALRAVQLNGAVALGYVYAAHSLIELNRKEEAARYLKKARQLAPGDVNVRYLEGFYKAKLPSSSTN